MFHQPTSGHQGSCRIAGNARKSVGRTHGNFHRICPMGSRHVTEMLDGVHVLNATELALKP